MGIKPTPSPFQLLGMGLATAVWIAAGMGVGYLVGDAVGASLACIFAGLALGIVAATLTVRSQVKRYM